MKTRPLGTNQQALQIKAWMETAVPHPTDRNIQVQIGVHLEEVAEMVKAMEGAALNASMKEKLSFLHDVITYAERQFKEVNDGIKIDPSKLDRVEMLDSLCDQIVTAIGAAHMLGFDILGGLQEVANSNDSKFDEEGKPIFNEFGKIMKGPNYMKPYLDPYT